MNFVDALKDAWEELWHHRMRTTLTLLGMIFGVGAVIAMLSIGEGAEREALKLVDSMGLRNIIVKAKSMDEQQLKEVREHSNGLSIRDVEVISSTLEYIEMSSTEKKMKTYLVISNGISSDASVLGVSPSHFTLSGFNTTLGDFFSNKHNNAFEQVAVIGAITAEHFYGEKNPIGQLIKINHAWVRVVGVIENKQLDKKEFQGIKLGGENNRIFIPIKTVIKKFKSPLLNNELDTIKLQIKEGISPYLAAIGIERLLSLRHGNVDDFEIVIPAKLMAQHQETRQIFTIVMSAVASISLLVGGIGIMNIMLATVLERTKEIGLLRAVGARQKDIMNLFMVESFTVSAIGGILGILLGFIIAQIIASYANWQIGFSFLSIILSVGVCALVGLIFGIFPARKAAKMDPIEALQRD